MDTIHRDPTIHELMDSMMGGEGSQSLEQAHANMGRKYFYCGDVVGRRSLNTNDPATAKMMPYRFSHFSLSLVNIMSFIFIMTSFLIIVLLCALIFYVWKKTKRLGK